MSLVARVLKEPLVHFFVLAAGLFVLSRVFWAAPTIEDTDAIVVSEQRVKSLILRFRRTWQRPPTRQELDGLVEDFIKEEVFYREALTMGLDRNDTLIRRRLRQKLEFVAEDLAATVEPTEQELQQFLADHPDSFRAEAQATFRHVYLKPALHEGSLEEDTRQLLAKLRSGGDSLDPTQLGDPFLLPQFQEDLRERDIAGQFGPRFASDLLALEAGEWNGPVESAYGVHLIFVEQKTEGRLPALDEIRDAVRQEWFVARRAASKEEFFQGLREKYEVVVEMPELSVE